MSNRYSLVEVPAELARWISDRGGRPLNLYRALAHAPRLLKAWLDFAYAIRHDCQTPRCLRELMILRTAQMHGSAYEWHQHRMMAREAGVPDWQIDQLAQWHASEAFDSRERAALALTEAMVAGEVNDAVHAALAEHFSMAECLELVMTAGFYCMVPRVLSALAVTTDGEPEARPSEP